MTEPAAQPPPSSQLSSAQQRRRNQILDHATPLFARHGFRQMDVQWVADAMGVGKGTIYRYFPSKQQLFLEAVDRGMQQLSQRVCDAAADEPDLLQRIRLSIKTYLQFFADNPALVELLMQERAEFKDRKKPTYFEYRDATAQHKRDFFAQLIEQGQLREIDADSIIQVIDNMLYGVIFTNYFAEQTPCAERQADQLIDVVFHGILSDDRRHAPPPGHTSHSQPSTEPD